MKLAKKVLAVVMALGLIACMSAMAFAAGSYSTELATADDGKTLVVKVFADDSIGLEADKIVVGYDGLKFDHAAVGADAKKVNDTADNGFFSDVNNKNDAGEVVFGFYFKENLWDANTFYENGAEAPVVINADHFHLVSFYFTGYSDTAAYSITVNGQEIAHAAPATEAPRTADSIPSEGGAANTPINPNPAQEGKTACNPEKADNSSAKPVKTDGGKNTGDNGVIAVMAGVIALAGAAFVVTKKRK